MGRSSGASDPSAHPGGATIPLEQGRIPEWSLPVLCGGLGLVVGVIVANLIAPDPLYVVRDVASQREVEGYRYPGAGYAVPAFLGLVAGGVSGIGAARLVGDRVSHARWIRYASLALGIVGGAVAAATVPKRCSAWDGLPGGAFVCEAMGPTSGWPALVIVMTLIGAGILALATSGGPAARRLRGWLRADDHWAARDLSSPATRRARMVTRILLVLAVLEGAAAVIFLAWGLVFVYGLVDSGLIVLAVPIIAAPAALAAVDVASVRRIRSGGALRDPVVLGLLVVLGTLLLAYLNGPIWGVSVGALLAGPAVVSALVRYPTMMWARSSLPGRHRP